MIRRIFSLLLLLIICTSFSYIVYHHKNSGIQIWVNHYWKRDIIKSDSNTLEIVSKIERNGLIYAKESVNINRINDTSEFTFRSFIKNNVNSLLSENIRNLDDSITTADFNQKIILSGTFIDSLQSKHRRILVLAEHNNFEVVIICSSPEVYFDEIKNQYLQFLRRIETTD